MIPPETSLSSRELAEQIGHLRRLYNEPFTHIVALIDAWVRVREVEAIIAYHKPKCLNCRGFRTGICGDLGGLKSALATARKQLEEKVK